jgi:hypothetical protein
MHAPIQTRSLRFQKEFDLALKLRCEGRISRATIANTRRNFAAVVVEGENAPVARDDRSQRRRPIPLQRSSAVSHRKCPTV